MSRPYWRPSDYLCPDCARRLESTTGPGGINCQECPNCEWAASYDPDADEHPSDELESARLATDGGEEVGRAITHTNELPRSVFEDLNRLPDARYLDYSEREVERACHYAERAADAGHSDTGPSSSLKRRAGWDDGE